MEDTLLILYCVVDEFCKGFYPEWEKTLISQGKIKRRRPSKISPARAHDYRYLLSHGSFS